MNPKHKAIENIGVYLNKRIKKNELKLLEYEDKEKVYGFKYENKKDVIRAENEFIDNLLRGDAVTQFNDDRLEKLQSKVNRLLGELDELQAYRMVECRFIEIAIQKSRILDEV
ncbi:hypothetical protein [Holdemanella sp.]|uniref:hypothetical protein n=1 Tax=Holdemanella sp. TaxID=1971762 RepID=UPI003AF0C7B4